MPWYCLVVERSTCSFQDVSTYPYAYGIPDSKAIIRSQPEDFQVEEQLSFQPEGEGEHVFLYLQKRNTNTEWLAKELARFSGVPLRDVSYAGLKDRKAITSQWFSIRMPAMDVPDWKDLESEDLKLLQTTRHRRKLRRGALAQNRFRLRLRELDADRYKIERRLEKIALNGVPNYYGEQRFGHDLNNLDMATKLFADGLKKVSRYKRGIYLSAARSYLFNMVLCKRVVDGTWDKAIPGDLVLLDGSHSHFSVVEINDEILRRIAELDIHPTGPLWGKGEQPVTEDAAETESAVLAHHLDWTQGLVRFGLSHERRALRSRVIDLKWAWSGDDNLQLWFGLYPGSYATAVLREVVSGA